MTPPIFSSITDFKSKMDLVNKRQSWAIKEYPRVALRSPYRKFIKGMIGRRLTVADVNTPSFRQFLKKLEKMEHEQPTKD
jgi:hypothetical protein